jgi:formate/nitrite transporter
MTPLHPTGIDAYKPNEIAALVEAAGTAKAHLPVSSMLTLAMLAGAFIALGAAAYTMVMTGADPGFGPHRFLGGIAFSLGLILVVVGGAELFTGNALMIMAVVDGKVSGAALLRAWTIVYLGNFVGALLIACLFAGTGLLDGPMGVTARAIAEGKAAIDPIEGFFRGFLCNVLVCLAVWLSIAARSASGKILAVIFPVAAFVMLGLEHSIANMFFFPQGLFAGSKIGAAPILTSMAGVTLGNILGGAGGVALSYRLAYRPV